MPGLVSFSASNDPPNNSAERRSRESEGYDLGDIKFAVGDTGRDHESRPDTEKRRDGKRKSAALEESRNQPVRDQESAKKCGAPRYHKCQNAGATNAQDSDDGVVQERKYDA